MTRHLPRGAIVLVVVMASSLAGCVEASSDRADGGGHPTHDADDGAIRAVPGSDALSEAVREVRGAACTGTHLAFLVPADRAQGALPDGLHAAGAPHDSLAQIQLRHAQCDRLVVDNVSDFPEFREVQLWIHVTPPNDLRPPAGSLSYYVLNVWQSGAPMGLFEARGLPVAAGDYSQATQTVVPDAWAVTSGEFQPADDHEAWSFEILSDDLPVPRTEQYRAFYGEDLGYYDLLVEGRIANQDYGGTLLAESGSTLASLSGTGGVNIELGGIFEETTLIASFEAR